MNVKIVKYSVCIPSVEEFGDVFPQYGHHSKREGRWLYRKIMVPENFKAMEVVTLTLGLPAIAGVAEMCYDAVFNHEYTGWFRFTRQYIGAVVCMMMMENGFERTGRVRSVRGTMFSKGAMYRLKDYVGDM